MSNLIRQKIISAIEKLAIPPKGAPSLVLFLLEGEEHEIGLLLASFMAKEMGWNVYYLGYGVPIPNIKKVVEIADPNLLMTMFVTPKMQKVNGFISAILEGIEVPFVISGSQENLDAVEDNDLVLKVSSPYDFRDELEKAQKNL